MSYPSYLDLHQSGELSERVETAWERLKDCTVCPRNCHVNRLEGELGVCKVGADPVVSGYGPHFGEERCLVGKGGSGTIFFTSCSLRCVFCQNYDISQLRMGEQGTVEKLGETMVNLQNMGCHNVNLVTPSHVVPQIIAALPFAIVKGLSIPLVYNTGGYDHVETLRLLDGIVDIYMPDIKYSDPEVALKYSGAKDYPRIAKAAVKEMHRQVGDLVIDERGIAERGLLVRHLVLPEGVAGTEEVMRFLGEEISIRTYVNVMDQYYPCYKAYETPPLDRKITREEYREAIAIARQHGITRLD